MHEISGEYHGWARDSQESSPTPQFKSTLEVRPSSVAPDPAESRGAPPPPQDPSPFPFHALEKEMATHSSVLACPDTPGSPEGNTEGPGTASSEPLLPS